ncbi:MAG: Zn-ribbon containing protein [Candidatus Micrarchaeota archaeon]|nr:Zn-ribbon containing protein [Candidatus Micrarchaeota archaeon]
MPHKCVRCGTVYDDEDVNTLAEGCGCGSKVFLFISGEEEEKKVGDTGWIEKELAGITNAGGVVVLEVENVRVLQDGVFELDISSLAKNPVVVKDNNEVYYIKLPGARKTG